MTGKLVWAFGDDKINLVSISYIPIFFQNDLFYVQWYKYVDS